VTMQISVATISDASCSPRAAHHSRPAKIAPSAIRSQVASRTAPKRVPPPRSRAIAPSSMSARTKTNTANAPHHSWPMGKSVSAAMTEPAVPMIVTLSGVRPIASAPFANGRLSFA